MQRCMKMVSPRSTDAGDIATGFASGTLRGFNVAVRLLHKRCPDVVEDTVDLLVGECLAPGGIEVPGTPFVNGVEEAGLRLGDHELGLGQVARPRIEINRIDAVAVTLFAVAARRREPCRSRRAIAGGGAVRESR